MSNSKSRYQGKPRGPRWGLIAVLVVVHVVGLYGLSRLLAPQFTASVEREVVEAFTVIITAPATEPEPEEGMQGSPGEEAEAREVSAPNPPIERNPQDLPEAASTGDERDSGAEAAGDGTGREGEGVGTGSGDGGGGTGNGIAVRPTVASGMLDPRRDFPIPAGGRQTRFGTSVTVVFTVTTDGRARNCSVARSSADAETTSLVCGLVIDKIRFNPARTAAGDPVEARYGYRVDFRAR